MSSTSTLEHESRRAFAAVGRVLGLEEWPPVPVRWNHRLRRAGRAVMVGHGTRFRRAEIELSPAYFEVYPQDLYGILVHEAVHVGLAIQGLDRGHGEDFRRTCEAAGGLQHGRALPGRVFRYRCPLCAVVIERRRRLADDRWCAPCFEAAERQGRDPFASGRALVLVSTGFTVPDSGGRTGIPGAGTGPSGQARYAVAHGFSQNVAEGGSDGDGACEILQGA